MPGLLSEARILIVDDESTNINILGETLSDDYIVSAANSGEEALRIVQQEKKPDMILLDILMPGLTGFEVCEELKANKDTADIAIIFVTALGDRIREETGFNLGALDYIQKPFSPTIVKVRVKVHLENIFYRKSLEFMLNIRADEIEKFDEERRQLLSKLGIKK